jgi:hypothetical protein
LGRISCFADNHRSKVKGRRNEACRNYTVAANAAQRFLLTLVPPSHQTYGNSKAQVSVALWILARCSN